MIFSLFLRSFYFIHSLGPRINFVLLFRLYEHLISFIHPLQDWIMILCYVFMNALFYSFIRSQIEFWSSATSLWALDFIHSSAPRLNFDLPLRPYKKLDIIHSLAPRMKFDLLSRLYEYLISFILTLLNWILIFCYVFTNTWFHSFIHFQIEFWSPASSLRTLDFIY